MLALADAWQAIVAYPLAVLAGIVIGLGASSRYLIVRRESYERRRCEREKRDAELRE
jgi:hypothetical protein